MNTTTPSPANPSGGAAAAPQVRGFAINRNDGRPPLPGSLHTNRRLSQWLDLSRQGIVRLHVGKVELGQGILTALALIAADELDVDFEAIEMVPASTVAGPDEGMTSSSISIQDSGTAVRHACAEVRWLALAKAAAQHRVEGATLSVTQGQIHSASGQLLGSYWSLLGPQDLDTEYQGRARPKAPQDRRLMGRARPPRLDLADKVFGRPRFVHDLRLEGMVHGRVIRPPSRTAQLLAVPDEVRAALPEGVHLVIDGRFVGVVAASERAAQAAALSLQDKLGWREEAALPAQSDLEHFLRSAPASTTVVAEVAPEPGHAAPAAVQRHEAQYFKPYLAHASIGPSCAVAHWDGQVLKVWTHSQGIQNLRDDMVVALAQGPMPVARERIEVRHVEGAGCYGHNGADDVAFDAVLLAMAHPGRPVRVLWSRADELAHAPLGAAQAMTLTAATDAQHRIVSWQHDIWANGYSSRPGRATVPTLLAAAHRSCGVPAPIAINPPLAAGGGSERNAVPAYALPQVKVLNHKLEVMPLRTSAMRALGGFANVFAIESFMDELAHAAGMDPVAYRKLHLHDERALAVIDSVISRCSWWSQRASEPEGVGHGFAWARYKNTSAWCAVAARIQAGHTIRVLDLELAVDVGQVIDLDGVINQVEGGALQSLSWTLKEQVCFDRTRVTSTDWDRYPILRFSEVPRVQVHVLDRPDQPSLGAGEAAQGPVAAALANAVFDALGVRVRTLPLSPEHILQAMG